MSFKHIELHRLAPAKPQRGEPCNGCGICCATEPCPVAMVFLGQRSGSCRTLLWRGSDSRYVCGMTLRPGRYLRWLPGFLEARAARWFAGRIAAGSGCDSDIEIIGE